MPDTPIPEWDALLSSVAHLRKILPEAVLVGGTAKVGKTTGAISVSFTSKKGNKAKYAVELVWRGDKLFAGHVTRTWKGVVDSKPANMTACGTAEVK